MLTTATNKAQSSSINTKKNAVASSWKSFSMFKLAFAVATAGIVATRNASSSFLIGIANILPEIEQVSSDLIIENSQADSFIENSGLDVMSYNSLSVSQQSFASTDYTQAALLYSASFLSRGSVPKMAFMFAGVSALSQVAYAQTYYCPPAYSPLTVTQGLPIILPKSFLLLDDGYDAYFPPSEMETIIIKNMAYGHFERVDEPGVIINSFSQGESDNNKIRLVPDGGTITPSFDIEYVGCDEYIDEYTISDRSINFQLNSTPELLKNSVSVFQGKKSLITNDNLLASDTDTSADDLAYLVRNVVGGYFQRSSTPGVPITEFKGSDLSPVSTIEFVDNGSGIAPSYNIQVTDGFTTTPVQAAQIEYSLNKAPTLTNNVLPLKQDVEFIIKQSNLLALDTDSPPNKIIYTLSEVSDIRFYNVNDKAATITSFTQEEVNNLEIAVLANPANQAGVPSFKIAVADEYNSVPQTQGNIQYTQNHAPTLTSNVLPLKQDIELILSQANLLATDSDSPVQKIIYTLIDVSDIRFYNVNDKATTITSFTQAEINNGDIAVLSNPSNQANVPSFNIVMSDEYNTLAKVKGNIVYKQNYAPVLTNNVFPLKQNQEQTLKKEHLLAIDSESAADKIVYTLTDVSDVRFYRINDKATDVYSFTQAQVNNFEIAFLSNPLSQGDAPSFNIIVSDEYNNEPKVQANIQYTPNRAPTLTNNNLLLKQGVEFVIKSDNLLASDLDSPATQVTYTVSDATNIRFYHVNDKATTITSFTQEQINTLQIAALSNPANQIDVPSLSNNLFPLKQEVIT